MAMQQKQRLLSDQQIYDYSSTRFTKNPLQNYPTEKNGSNNQEIYLSRIFSKLKVLSLPVSLDAKNVLL